MKLHPQASPLYFIFAKIKMQTFDYYLENFKISPSNFVLINWNSNSRILPHETIFQSRPSNFTIFDFRHEILNFIHISNHLPQNFTILIFEHGLLIFTFISKHILTTQSLNITTIRKLTKHILTFSIIQI